MLVPQPPRVAIVIPARYSSTRFPGKPLISIGGMTMIERVYRQAEGSKYADHVLVATDDDRIRATVRNFGGNVVMTGSHHQSGTDRLAEVALLQPEIDIIVNVQGDEPLISPKTIDAVIHPLLFDRNVKMSTVAAKITDVNEITSNTIVKVVLDRAGDALYFSRLPIPYVRDAADAAQTTYFAHIGLYAYERETLLQISAASRTMLEAAESLEQLRALEHQVKIRVVEVPSRSPAIDCPEDVLVVERALAVSTGVTGGFVPGFSVQTPVRG